MRKSGKNKFNEAHVLLNRPACSIAANTYDPVIITNDGDLQDYLKNVQFQDVDKITKLENSIYKITQSLIKIHNQHIGASKRCCKHVNPMVRKICSLIKQSQKAIMRRVSTVAR